MTNDNLIPSKGDLDLFESTILIWKHKWQLIIILAIFIAIGGAYTYLYLPMTDASDKHITSINILIENNPILEEEEIVKEINSNLPSAYNYEKWSKDNKSLSDILTQNYASVLIVTDKTHVVNLISISENTLEAIVSYLTSTIKIISDKITMQIQNEVEEKIRIIDNEIKNSFNYNEQLRNQFEIKIQSKRKAYETEINAMENAIISKKIDVSAAEEELLFIKNNITLATQNSPEIILRQLNLTNQNKVNKSIIQNLIKRKEALFTLLFSKDSENLETTEGISQIQTSEIALETQLNQKLSDLNAELLDFINTHLSKDTQARSDVTLRILDLKNTISSHRVIRGLGEVELNLELEALAQETKERMMALDLEIKELNGKLVNISNKDIIHVGRISKSIVKVDSNPSFFLVLIISVLAGIIFGIFYVFFKEEFLKRDKLQKKALKQ